MKTRRVLILVLTLCIAAPASAGIIFGKKNKPNPRDRVPELIAIAKTDGDENKRASAAEELRHYDPGTFPEIVPVLIDVLVNDKKPSVRSEAAQSLGSLRPISQAAGLALEEALAKDSSMMVRLQARRALLSYRWAGYRSVKKDEVAMPSTKEPPLADAGAKQSDAVTVRKTSQPRVTSQAEPAVRIEPPVITTIPGARPLPSGPVIPTSSGVPAGEAKGTGPSLE